MVFLNVLTFADCLFFSFILLPSNRRPEMFVKIDPVCRCRWSSGCWKLNSIHCLSLTHTYSLWNNLIFFLFFLTETADGFSYSAKYRFFFSFLAVRESFLTMTRNKQKIKNKQTYYSCSITYDEQMIKLRLFFVVLTFIRNLCTH